MSTDPRRRIPRTDHLLDDPRLATAARSHREQVRGVVRAAQDLARAGQIRPEDVLEEAVRALPDALPDSRGSIRPALNATGVVVHTNLGRAPLSAEAIEAVREAAGYATVEYDVSTGQRGPRGAAVLQALRDRVPAAGDALVVNNGAAALLLAVTTLAGHTSAGAISAGATSAGAGLEVVVSRGELVEIGDGFRLPDLMASTGARLREVGTTNRTRVEDYAAAIGPQTGCIVKIHPSNFRVEGFTGGVDLPDLAALGVPVVMDTGSGLLQPDPALPDEPDASTALAQGASVVTASGDKLLGGPQAGLVLGDAELIAAMRRHPMARALRVDKLTLAALEATLRGGRAPVTLARTADPSRLQARARALADLVGGRVRAHDGVVGGGGAPGVRLPGWAVALPQELAAPLRAGDPAVVGRVESGELLLDLRCVPEDSDATVAAAVRAAVETLG